MWIPPAAPTAARARSALKLKSGMQWPSGPGTLWLITVPIAGTTLWIFVSNVRPTRRHYFRRVYGCMGRLQPCFSFPLHLSMA
uniref:Uncharacterized protein n=1 Tax=Mus musculus TaxID=10090 RepID=Q3V497_MOUSE|nr:unnamed protein product [Mus musculus]